MAFGCALATMSKPFGIVLLNSSLLKLAIYLKSNLPCLILCKIIIFGRNKKLVHRELCMNEVVFNENLLRILYPSKIELLGRLEKRKA